MVEQILLIVLIVLVLIVLLVVLLRRRIETTDIEPALSRMWNRSGIAEKVGELTTRARDIQEAHKSIEQMLRVPKERASFGEISLETILSDQLPPEMFDMRARVFDGKVPDAHIRSTVGLICIDSKFPLDNYMEMIQAQDVTAKDALKRRFIKDVQGHMEKIRDDYVRPDRGSADFAFAYIPSEAVYYFLVIEAYAMLREFTKSGVQVVSPLTLSHKVELVKAGVYAHKLSQQAEKVRSDILNLSRHFDQIDEMWRVFYQTHLRSAGNKTDELDQAYSRVRQEFHRISSMSSDQQEEISRGRVIDDQDAPMTPRDG